MPLDDYFYDQGFEVKLPLFDGDEAAIADHHQEMLHLCDAIVIYYGHENKAWVEHQLSKLRQIPDAQQKTTAIYVTDPKKDDRKERYRTREVDVVIKHFEAFSPDVLAPLLDLIKTQRGGPGS